MAFFLAISLGLVIWPLVSHIYPALLALPPFRSSLARLDKDGIITPSLATFIEETLARESIVGLSVALIPKHGESKFHTWGFRTEDGDEVTPNTLFHTASVSKAFCATALGLLMDDFASGKNVTALPSGLTEFSWHTRLSEVLPDWHLMDEWASKRATLRDILSHVSGLPRHDFLFGPSDAPQELITRLKYLKPASEFREQWSYNNMMYMVAAHIVATYAGQSYTTFVEERIFSPLGMTSSTFSVTTKESFGKSSQGWTKYGRRLPEPFTEDTAFVMAGPAGIRSNTVDIAKWTLMWIGEGVYNNQTIIPLSVYKNMSYPHTTVTSHPRHSEHSIIAYGMGWYRSSYRGHDIVFHSGNVPGFSALVSFLPTDEIGVVLFANCERKNTILMLILNRILDSALRLSGSLIPESLSSSKVTTKVSSGQNLTLSLDALAGTFTNPGYGSFMLCSPSGASPPCVGTRSDFLVVDSIGGNPATNDLFAAWPRVWSSHLRLRHKHDLVFEIYFTSLYPKGYGKNRMPFETMVPELNAPHGLAEFVVADGKMVGFGMRGLTGQLAERAFEYETVQDRAEVWFDKV